jgi:hypothetical protein
MHCGPASMALPHQACACAMTSHAAFGMQAPTSTQPQMLSFSGTLRWCTWIPGKRAWSSDWMLIHNNRKFLICMSYTC